MTPETMKFWLDIFHSPVALTLAGALLGAVSTLAGVWLKSRHDIKENQKTWERQEITRKEERAFDKKSKAYEDFFVCFETTVNEGISNFDKYIGPVIMRLMLYGPLPVKIPARAALECYRNLPPPTAPEKFAKSMEELRKHLNDVHTAMMGDVDNHFSRDDVKVWKHSLEKSISG